MRAGRAARTWVVSAALPAVVVAALALALPRFADRASPSGRWAVNAVQWVEVAATGQPLVVFADASCSTCAGPRIQLRVCREDGTACDVGARRAPNPDGATRLRYARPLDPGRYRLELLFLDRDGWGATRSLLRAEGWIDVR